MSVILLDFEEQARIKSQITVNIHFGSVGQVYLIETLFLLLTNDERQSYTSKLLNFWVTICNECDDPAPTLIQN